MITGIGTDILRLDRIKNILDDGNPAFVGRVFTSREQEEGKLRENPLIYYAGRFSAKEAVFKALGISSDHVRLTDIEILNDRNGKPGVILWGTLADIAQIKQINQIELSISSDSDYTVAFAIAISQS